MSAESQLATDESICNQFAEGDRVQVHIESPASPFGGTQMASFDVTEVNADTVFGVDPNWDDEVEILVGDGQPHYADAGKSGDVVRIDVMDTVDGTTVAGSGRTVYDYGAGAGR